MFGILQITANNYETNLLYAFLYSPKPTDLTKDGTYPLTLWSTSICWATYPSLSHPTYSETYMRWNIEECSKHLNSYKSIPWIVPPDNMLMLSRITNVAWHPTVFSSHSACVNWIAWHPTKKVFLSASDDKQIKKIKMVGRKVRERVLEIPG